MELESQITCDEYVRWLDECWKFLDFGRMKVVGMLDLVRLFGEEFEKL